MKPVAERYNPPSDRVPYCETFKDNASSSISLSPFALAARLAFEGSRAATGDSDFHFSQEAVTGPAFCRADNLCQKIQLSASVFYYRRRTEYSAGLGREASVLG